MATLPLTLSTGATLPAPHKGRWLSVPMRGYGLEPGHDLRGIGRMLSVEDTPFENTLDAFRHIQPRTAQRRVQRHDPLSKQPQNEFRRLVTRQIIQNQQHPQRRERLR